MDFINIEMQLATYGVVEYLGYNGDNQDIVLVVLNNVNENYLDLINAIVNAEIRPTHPTTNHYSFIDSVYKLELKAI